MSYFKSPSKPLGFEHGLGARPGLDPSPKVGYLALQNLWDLVWAKTWGKPITIDIPNRRIVLSATVCEIISRNAFFIKF